MAAVDAARNGRFSDADIDAPAAESPVRERMRPGDHLGDQFAGIEHEHAEPPAGRPPTSHRRLERACLAQPNQPHTE